MRVSHHLSKYDDQNPSYGSIAEKNSRYDIGELATSSLIGLVATIKEHITKPTAMAQGRVAHLIEWKGWGGCGEDGRGRGGWSGAWGKGGGGWGGMGAELQEDEQYYSQMTDEIKEARFAAGVAEQFALAEAAMNMWSMNDNLEQPSTSLQAAQSHFLSQFLLDGGSVGVPQHLYSIHAQTHGNNSAVNLVQPPPVNSNFPTPNTQQDRAQPFEDRNNMTAEAAVRHVDSSSLSEDDVFYN
ncbi:protein FAM131C isoform X3 [Acanthochromis polyacanthus]|uniref:protein FAM131C isoform X3 n=1 Tax=Acanthochromis polyacanthus TaxID=80966 RepID=UPI002234A428|nr:protein FAM131C isoform X3 [Acanthochromis polyacanthus]XP_051805391.1 protein FAM131C isoform X3 [Acanthochromis polyacanthus]